MRCRCRSASSNSDPAGSARFGHDDVHRVLAAVQGHRCRRRPFATEAAEFDRQLGCWIEHELGALADGSDCRTAAHFQLAGGTNDRRRDRRSHVVGWQVERVSPLDLTDVDGVCDELAELYRRRCLAITGVFPDGSGEVVRVTPAHPGVLGNLG